MLGDTRRSGWLSWTPVSMMARRTLAGEVDVAFCAWVKWKAACRLHHRQKQQHAHHGGATCPTGATSCSFWLLALLAAGTRMPQPCQQALGAAHLGGARPAVDVCPHEADAGIDGLQTHACGQIRLCQQMVVTMWPWWCAHAAKPAASACTAAPTSASVACTTPSASTIATRGSSLRR